MKDIYRLFSLTILLASTSLSVSAQSSDLITLHGNGRSVLTNNSLKGDILDGDTLTPRKGFSGYNLMDLNFNINAGRSLELITIFRIRQPWGEFWGEETDFEFRQLTARGELNNIGYEIGDINLKLTPYTLFSNDEFDYKNESLLYSMRRDLADYENFIVDNYWRLQGAQVGTSYNLNTKNDSLDIYIFGARTNATNDDNIPDRILAGGKVEFRKFEKLNLGFNYIGLQDLQIENAAITYKNHVITGSGDYSIKVNASKLTLGGETGMSFLNYQDANDNEVVAYNDHFIDAFAKFKLSKGPNFMIKYKDVGPGFSSPGAQSKRINVSEAPLLFSLVNDNAVDRASILFDRYGQENIYFQSLSPVLRSFNPAYNNTTPYGEATPNRNGFVASVSDTIGELNVVISGMRFSEIVGEGVKELKSFTVAKIGLEYDLSSLFDKPKEKLVIGGGVRYEKTSRDGLAAIDLTSNLIEGYLNYQVAKGATLLLGTKLFQANGNEYLSSRNEFNELGVFSLMRIDATEMNYSLGIKVDFNERSNLLLSYYINNLDNKLDDNSSYRINQLFLNFNLLF